MPAKDVAPVVVASPDLGIEAVPTKRLPPVNNKSRLRKNFDARELAAVMISMAERKLIFLKDVRELNSLYSKKREELLALLNSRVIPNVYAECAKAREPLKETRKSFDEKQREEYESLLKLSSDAIQKAMRSIMANRSTSTSLHELEEYKHLRKKDLVTVLVKDGYAQRVIVTADGAKQLQRANKQAAEEKRQGQEVIEKQGNVVTLSREQLEARSAAAAQSTKKTGKR